MSRGIGLGMLRPDNRCARMDSASQREQHREGAKLIDNSSGLTMRCECRCLLCENGWSSSGAGETSGFIRCNPCLRSSTGKMLPIRFGLSLYHRGFATLYIQSYAPQDEVSFHIQFFTICPVAMLSGSLLPHVHSPRDLQARALAALEPACSPATLINLSSTRPSITNSATRPLPFVTVAKV
jgi:hypothetical protein